MGTTLGIQITILVALLFFSAFFSMSETALMSMSKIRLRHLVENHVKHAKLTQDLLDHPNQLLGTILVGNNLVNIAASAIATSIAIYFWNNKGVGIATFLMTLLILIFGEITPKNIAIDYTEEIVLFIAPIMNVFVKIFSPIVWVLTNFTNGLLHLFGVNKQEKKPLITEEELKTIVEVSSQEGVLESDEKEIIDNIFEYSDMRVKDIMIQRMDIVAVDVSATYEEVVAAFGEKQFSRIPVYEDTIDNIVGVLYAKDLFFIPVEKIKQFDIKKYMREPFYTYEFIKISDFFRRMQGDRIHIAIVLDEYGGVAGIITMEDIIESILGDINDEYDPQDEEDIVCIKEGEYLVNGSVRLEDLNEEIGTHFESEDFESIGGFILGILGRIPRTGEIINYESIRFVIEKVDKSRIMKIRLFY
ncbi:hemolysin family protein [Filifactor alocis]|uniref:hemolysin family protein n=1 Tax=Filifactor alocis TaxID=143361 RepID=UPI0028EDD9CC|nr:hemolysin family protein [Filifactor alocis]